MMCATAEHRQLPPSSVPVEHEEEEEEEEWLELETDEVPKRVLSIPIRGGHLDTCRIRLYLQNVSWWGWYGV